jgi:hypothetical protein
MGSTRHEIGDIAARHRSPVMSVSSETRILRSGRTTHGYSNSNDNRAPAFARTCNRESLSYGDLLQRLISMGSADIEQMLIDTHGSSRLFRSVRGRAPNFIEHDLREYAEPAEECTQATLDMNCKALGIIIEFESMDNTQQV